MPTSSLKTFARTRHQQFIHFEVILLVFSTPQAVYDLLTGEDYRFPDDWRELTPGQLVAVCLTGDEGNHARHYPVFGLVDLDQASLHDNVDMLSSAFAAKNTSTSQRYSVWQTGNDDVKCDDRQLANAFAEFGDEVIRKHLYKWDISPHLHASESRRMAFNERWTYASINEGVLPANSIPQAAKWIREPQDDTLIPCLSLEWSLSDSQAQLSSKTGYYIKVTNEPILAILNRHYPHCREAGVQFTQLLPPTIALNRSTVKHHQVNGKLHRAKLVLRQLEDEDMRAHSSSTEKCKNSVLSIEAVSHLVDLVLKLKTSHHPAIDPFYRSTVEEIAGKLKCYIQKSDIGHQSSNACNSPTPEEVKDLILASFCCLKKWFGCAEDVLTPFGKATSETMTLNSVRPYICSTVMNCFFTTWRLALANTAPLCGREILEEEEQQETHSRMDLAEPQSPFKADKERRAEDLARNILECQASEAETVHNTQHSFDFGSQQESCSDRDDEDIYVDSDEADSLVRHSTRNRKRTIKLVVSHGKDKMARFDNYEASLINSWLSPERRGYELDGVSFKEFIELAMNRSTDEARKPYLADCIRLIRTSVQQEYIQAKPLSQETSKACRNIFQKSDFSIERRALLLKMAVDGISRMAERGDDDGNLEWILLTLAFRANKIVNQLSDMVEDACKNHLTFDPTFPNLLINLEEKGLSQPFIKVVDRVRFFLDNLEGDSGKKYRTQGVVGESLVKSLVEVLRAAPNELNHFQGQQLRQSSSSTTGSVDSSSSGSTLIEMDWSRKVPQVYINFMNRGDFSGSKADKKSGRLKEMVSDVLFQSYFNPLIRYLTSRKLDGSVEDDVRYTAWPTKRRFLKFRMDLIDKLVEDCKLGTAIFATRVCSDIVIAPARYLPLPAPEDGFDFYQYKKAYTFPCLTVRQGKIVREAPSTINYQGWEALFSSLRDVKGDVQILARRKDPTQSIPHH